MKVLSPDLAAGVSAEQFTRKIELAANLQQANIVPLLSAAASRSSARRRKDSLKQRSMVRGMRLRRVAPLESVV